jgi:glycosyltransferase involved in cell wall biosynthesis
MIHVLHLTDTLEVGGKERMVLNTVNLLPKDRYKVSVCTTRHEGRLAKAIAPDIRHINLQRTHKIDLKALRKLVRFIDEEQVQIVHAHNAAIFYAFAAVLFRPSVKLIWHNHMEAWENRWLWKFYGFIIWRIQAAIAVNQQTQDWFLKLGLTPQRIFYLPNFSILATPNGSGETLRGTEGKKIICVANVRPEKDFETLVSAMAEVFREEPEARLFSVGEAGTPYAEKIKNKIAEQKIENKFLFLGLKENVADYLSQCNIGVLSSRQEGLPLALLEYGAANLAVVCTRVGQCEEVLQYGEAGYLVDKENPALFAEMLLKLLKSPEKQKKMGAKLSERVRDLYSGQGGVNKLGKIYQEVLSR